MKSVMLTLMMLIGFNTFAAVETAQVYVSRGGMPNPTLAPLGEVVNVATGEVLYVNSVISVLAPKQLKTDCLYQVNLVRDPVMRTRVRLVPPMQRLTCGHDFGRSK